MVFGERLCLLQRAGLGSSDDVAVTAAAFALIADRVTTAFVALAILFAVIALVPFEKVFAADVTRS
jgi:hypothetical protein